jgi:hypothetical protein
MNYTPSNITSYWIANDLYICIWEDGLKVEEYNLIPISQLGYSLMPALI